MAANSGNYLITEGAYRAFEGHDIQYVPFWYLVKQIDRKEFIELLAKEYDFCLFVTANILNADFDLTNEICVLEAMPLPTIFMSIGVQRRSDLAGNLHPSAARFIEFLKQDKSFTFTRGAFAAQFLRSQGVTNVFESCCPSAFNFSEQIVRGVRRLKDVDLSDLGEVWVNGYLGGGSEFTGGDLRALRPASRRLGYVFQDEPLLFGAMRNLEGEKRVYNDGAGVLTTTPYCHEATGLPSKSVDYYAFFSPEQWRARSAAVDVFVGRRFHGCLIGLQAGRPAVCIAHDDRVTEMLESVGIPFVSSEEWDRSENKLEHMGDFIREIDIGKFEAIYERKKNEFSDTINKVLA